MSKVANWIQDKFKYIAPSLVTMVLFLMVLFSKDIYPFGDETIDYYDMAQQIAAFYYHVYDALHGDKAFFFDWYSALGTNMAMSTSGCSNISIFNLFFLFIERESLLKSLSIFNMIKMMCMSGTMFFFLHKRFSSPYFLKLLMSVGYAFSGFVLVLYITNQWMDIAVLFPLIVYFAGNAITKREWIGYLITLTLAVINSYYISFMIMIFLFLSVGVFVFYEYIYSRKTGKEKTRKYELVPFAVATFFSVLISAFIFLPQLYQTLSSARFMNENGGGLLDTYLNIASKVNGAFTTRYWSLLMLSLPAVVILLGILKKKKSQKDVLITVTLILLMVLELFFESINLIWHFGSYVQYPIRNGFMINFVFGAAACFFTEGEEPGIAPDMDGRKLRFVLAVPACLALFYGFTKFYALDLFQGKLRYVFHLTFAIALCSAILHFVFCNCFKGRIKWCSLYLFALEALIFGFILFGKPAFETGYSEEPEQEGEYIRICNELFDALDFDKSYANRIKNPDESLNSNYGFVLRRPALSNWTHVISPDVQSGANLLGYSTQFTRVLDAGGTVFTDVLLGINNVISCVPQDEALYDPLESVEVLLDEKTGEYADYTLYQCRYTLPFGKVVHKLRGYVADNLDLVEAQNILYAALIDGLDSEVEAGEKRNHKIAGWIVKGNTEISDALMECSVVENDTERGNVRTENYEIFVNGNKSLYFSGAGGDVEYRNTKIYVNGKPVTIPSIKEVDNDLYPAHFNNNAVFLGAFENENVTVSVVKRIDENVYDTEISFVNMYKLSALCARRSVFATRTYVKKNTMEIDTTCSDSDENANLLLPVTFDEGWKIEINGREVNNATSVGGLFTLIPLVNGSNQVIMTFRPKGMTVGIIISIVSFIMCLSYGVMSNLPEKSVMLPEEEQTAKEGGLFDDGNRFELVMDQAETILKYVYLLAFALLLLGMYLFPIAYGILNML